MKMRNIISIVMEANDEIPNEVFQNLRHWTDKWGRSLKPETIDWLKNNVPRPVAPLTLYRGISFGIDDVIRVQNTFSDKLPKYIGKSTKAWNKYVDEYNEAKKQTRTMAIDALSKKYLGIAGEDIKVGASVTINRRKPVSWSLDKKWTYEFAAQGVAVYGIIIKAEVPSEKIIADLTRLPDDVHRAISKYHYKQEVLTMGSITGQIIEVGNFETLRTRFPQFSKF